MDYMNHAIRDLLRQKTESLCPLEEWLGYMELDDAPYPDFVENHRSFKATVKTERGLLIYVAVISLKHIEDGSLTIYKEEHGFHNVPTE